MTTLNLQLPDHLKIFADQRAAEMGFPSASAYLESLLDREARRRDALAKPESELLNGLDSGEPIDADERYWKKKKHDLIARHDQPWEQLHEGTNVKWLQRDGESYARARSSQRQKKANAMRQRKPLDVFI